MSGASARPRILVVDDDRVFCSILEEWLGTRYEVLVAHDGEEALRLLAQVRPAAIILDVMLPAISGLGVGWVLRQDLRYKDIPVILVSAQEGSIKEARETLTDADAYMLKPISLEYLSAFLRQHIPEALQDLGLHAPSVVYEPEKRSSPRVVVSLPARLSVPAGIHDGTIVSLSLLGAFVRCEGEIAAETAALLTFDHRADHIAKQCTVVYSALRDGHRGVGVRFLPLSSENEPALVRVLAESPREAPPPEA